jgi:hypothetical protein
VKQALIQAPMVVNQADAKRNATLATNLAENKSNLQVMQKTSDAYKYLMQGTFTTDRQKLNYIKQKTINQFNPKNLLAFFE